MSQNENQKTNSTTTDVLVAVAEQLKNSNESVKTNLVNVMVQRELVKRVDLLDKGVSKLRELKKELDKIKPVDRFSADGTKVPGDFSKSELDSLKKAREKVSKLEGALEKAFAGQEFDRLANLAAGKEAPPDSNSDE